MGGDSTPVASSLASGVSQIFSTISAFAALKSDGSVVTWGSFLNGGNSTPVASRLASGVSQIFSTNSAFAALKSDGSVVTWGSFLNGGDSSAVAAKLASGVSRIVASGSVFAAIKTDGSLITWGDSSAGGNSRLVAERLAAGVKDVYFSSGSVAALKSDGSVVTWGDYSAGNSALVANQLSSGVVSFATPYSDDRLIFSDTDSIAGGPGNDSLYGSQANDSLYGLGGNDSLLGGNGNDILDGGAGADTINGGAGDDYLDGGDGVDLLQGSANGRGELDVLRGGAGGDRFVLGSSSGVFYDDGTAETTGNTDYAIIEDFDPTEDKIRLAGSSADYKLSTVGADTAIFFVGSSGEADELIAVIRNQTSLNLTGAYFEYPFASPSNSVSIFVSPVQVYESSAGTLAYTFTRSGSINSPLTVFFSVAGSALLGSDYQIIASDRLNMAASAVTFAAGEKSVVINIQPKEDLVLEENENVLITIQPSSHYLIGAASSASAFISQTTPLVLAAVTNGTLASGETKAYSIAAAAGDKFFLRMGRPEASSSAVNPTWRIYGPDGALVQSVGEAPDYADSGTYIQGDFTAAASGTYTLLVADNLGNDSGAYSLSVHRTKEPADATPVVFGTVITNTLASGEIKPYSFAAAAGERLFLRMGRPEGGTSAVNPTWRIYGPDGALVPPSGRPIRRNSRSPAAAAKL